MKAMIITQFGGPEVFEEREVPSPHPQVHQLLVDVMQCDSGIDGARLTACASASAEAPTEKL